MSVSTKKIAALISQVDISLKSLSNIKDQLMSLAGENSISMDDIAAAATTSRRPINNEEFGALEVVEGYFNGESMTGDNGQTYTVPPNYASKTQLIIGDRLKRILTSDRESYKLTKPAERDRVVGTFQAEGENYWVFVKGITSPVQILKASATFAMKNLGLRLGDSVAIIVPKDTTPVWGALSSVVTGGGMEKPAATSQYMAGNVEHDPTPTVIPPSTPATNYFSSENEYL
jgi:hypothetical protein